IPKNWGMRIPHWLPVLLLSSLAGCSTVPTHRLRNAASVPRLVDVNPYSFHEEGRPTRLGGSAGAHYGFALSDTGNAHGAEIFHLGLAFRGPRFGLGWNPYVAFAKVSHEGTGGFGHHLWGALHFGGGSHWRFSAQLSLAAMTKVNEDK